MVSLTKFSTSLPSSLVSLARPLAMRLLRPKMLRFYSAFVSRGDFVFDIGAHVGDHTSCFLKLGCRVISVDPNPTCADSLRKRFHDRPDASVIQSGVGAKAGELLPFYVCADSSALSTFSEHWMSSDRFSKERYSEPKSVSMTTLDALIERFGQPSFCKIDVEGFEKQVLFGLSSPIKTLTFEFTKEFVADARACIERLSSLGYSCFNYSIYNEFRLQSPGWLSAEDLLIVLESSQDDRLCGDIVAKLGAAGKVF